MVKVTGAYGNVDVAGLNCDCPHAVDSPVIERLTAALKAPIGAMVMETVLWRPCEMVTVVGGGAGGPGGGGGLMLIVKLCAIARGESAQ